MATDLGIFVGNNASAVRGFERWLGRPVGSVLAYTGNPDWNSCDPGWQIGGGSYLGATGRRLRWSIPAWPENNHLAEMRSVARGEQFGRHQGWARQCLAHRSGDSDPIYVRTCWELGGEWFWWTHDAQADGAAFRQAVARFYEAFKSVSPRFKTQFDFVPDRGPVEQWYPGDAAIDIISQDVYWHVQYDGTDPVAAFNRHNTGLTYGLHWVRTFALAHAKGVAIPEWGVPGANGNPHNGARFIELMADWMARNGVIFADYWDSTSAYDGLLSDGDPAGTAAALKKLYLEGVGTGPTPVPVPTPTPTPVPTPAPTEGKPAVITAGEGPDTLALKVAQDYYRGPAQYTVAVDGKQVGGTFTAAARRGAGEDTLSLHGNWPAGTHTVAVRFLNDEWGGTPNTDRNLYLGDATYNGAAIPGANFQMLSQGTYSFAFTDTGAAPAPVPVPVPEPEPTPAPGTDWEAEAKRLAAEVAVLKDDVARLSGERATLAARAAQLQQAAQKAVDGLNFALAG